LFYAGKQVCMAVGVALAVVQQKSLDDGEERVLALENARTHALEAMFRSYETAGCQSVFLLSFRSLRKECSHLFCIQGLPHSNVKNTGCGYGHPFSSFGNLPRHPLSSSWTTY
jgi:hypothetical protein